MNKLFAILIMCALSIPVFATEERESESVPVNKENLEVLTTEEIDELNRTTPQDTNMLTAPESLPSHFKEPVSKKKLATKFIIAMLCVAGTAVFLYVTLSAYNKLRDGFITEQTSVPPTEGEQPLEAPNDLTEAVKTFIDKTHWQG